MHSHQRPHRVTFSGMSSYDTLKMHDHAKTLNMKEWNECVYVCVYAEFDAN